MEAGSYMPHTVDEIFRDFKGRRNGMIKALTVDVDEFYRRCDPDKDNLSLYGYPEGTWEVSLPAEEIPPELPEPVLGINFAREGMERGDWLSLVAVHSDAWLLAVASFYSAQLDKHDRKRLFNMIGDPPTVFHVVSGRKVAKEKGTESNGANKTKSNIKMSKQSVIPAAHPKEEESDQECHENEDEEEQGETFCGCCGGLYTGNELWICCDLCERWFHAKCVKITPARAEHIKQYKCPSCSSGSGSGSNKRSHS